MKRKTNNVWMVMAPMNDKEMRVHMDFGDRMETWYYDHTNQRFNCESVARFSSEQPVTCGAQILKLYFKDKDSEE